MQGHRAAILRLDAADSALQASRQAAEACINEHMQRLQAKLRAKWVHVAG